MLVVLPGLPETRKDPHEGQKVPFGHITDSSHLLALASVENFLTIAWTGRETRSGQPGPPLPTTPDAMSASRTCCFAIALYPHIAVFPSAANPGAVRMQRNPSKSIFGLSEPYSANESKSQAESDQVRFFENGVDQSEIVWKAGEGPPRGRSEYCN